MGADTVTKGNLKNQKQPVQDQPVQDQPVQKTPVQEQPVQKPPMQDQPVQKLPVQDQPVQKSPVQEQPVQKPPMQEQPVQKPPVQEQPFKVSDGVFSRFDFLAYLFGENQDSKKQQKTIAELFGPRPLDPQSTLTLNDISLYILFKGYYAYLLKKMNEPKQKVFYVDGEQLPYDFLLWQLELMTDFYIKLTNHPIYLNQQTWAVYRAYINDEKSPYDFSSQLDDAHQYIHNQILLTVNRQSKFQYGALTMGILIISSLLIGSAFAPSITISGHYILVLFGLLGMLATLVPGHKLFQQQTKPDPMHHEKAWTAEDKDGGYLIESAHRTSFMFNAKQQAIEKAKAELMDSPDSPLTRANKEIQHHIFNRVAPIEPENSHATQIKKDLSLIISSITKASFLAQYESTYRSYELYTKAHRGNPNTHLSAHFLANKRPQNSYRTEVGKHVFSTIGRPIHKIKLELK